MAATSRALARAPAFSRPPALELHRNGRAHGPAFGDRLQAYAVGARVASSRQLQQLSWKTNAAKTCLDLASGGLAALIPPNRARGRKPRGHANDVEVELAEEPSTCYRRKRKSLDCVEESPPHATRFLASENNGEIVPQDRSRGDDYLPWTSKGLEFITYLLHQLPASWKEGDRISTVVKLAVIALMTGLHACFPAWGAVNEIANSNVDSGFFGDLDDIQNGFASSFLLIFFSEIGDKTFFIAALLATRKPGVAVFSGTFGALAVMTLITVVLGRAFHYVDELLPSLGDTRIPWDDLAAVVLLVYFGVSTLIEAASMEESKQEEEQQEAELAIAGVGGNGAVAGTVATTFALVFVAEWGDKSFFSTIALAAASSPVGVVTGAVAGHGAATLLAVLGGSFLANYVSEKVIAYVGGTLFLVFAGITLIETVT